MHAGTTHTGRTTPPSATITTAVTNVAVIANSAHVELLWRGLRAGMPRPWRVKALRSDGQVIPVRGGVDATRLLGQGVGPISAWCGREEPAGLPAQGVAVVPAPLLLRTQL